MGYRGVKINHPATDETLGETDCATEIVSVFVHTTHRIAPLVEHCERNTIKQKRALHIRFV